jgi:hypothetical protein
MTTTPDFNRDGQITQQDVLDYLSVFSEGSSSTGQSDSIDTNNDGAVYDPDDLDAYVNRMRWGLPIVMPWKPKVDEFDAAVVPEPDRLIRVSSSIGDDTNDGIHAPVRTLRRAYDLVRHDSGDHVALRCGDIWNEKFQNEYGVWDKGGVSDERPLVIRSYTDAPGRPKPKIVYRTPAHASEPGTTIALQGDRLRGYVWIMGLDFSPQDGYRGHGAIRVYANCEGILIEGNEINGGNSLGNFDGIVNHGLRRVALRRNYVGFTESSEDGAHSGGFYMVRSENALVELNNFEHCGWGAVREEKNKFCQVGYVVADAGTFQREAFLAVNNLVTDPGHAAFQLRAGLAFAAFNDIRNAPIGISGGHAMASPENPWRGMIAHNTIRGWGAIPGAAQGECIRVSRGRGAWVFNNQFENPRQTIVYETPVGDIRVMGNRVASA